LPKNLPNPPTYKKVNPADTPILILGLTSDVLTLHEIDQYADLNIAQRISMLPGIGQVVIFGEQKYAPTIQINPMAMAARGIGVDDVATALTNNTLESPLGALQGPQQAYQINANSQLVQPSALAQVIVAYRNGAPVRVSDIGRVVDGSDVPLQLDWVNNHIGEMIGIWRQPGSNTLELVGKIKAGIPPSIKLVVVSDRSISVAASFADVKDHADVYDRAGDPRHLCLSAQLLGDRDPEYHCAAGAGRHLCRALSRRLQPRQYIVDGADAGSGTRRR